MELGDIILAGLDRAKMSASRALDGLTQFEITWRPGPEANSIGIILYHTARFEDILIQARVQGKPQIWETEKWYEKLGRPAADTGFGYTVEQLAEFKVPELKDLVAYQDAARARTVEFVKGLPPEQFDRIITLPRIGDQKIGVFLAHMVGHIAQHAGEIGYIRGLQRGLNK